MKKGKKLLSLLLCTVMTTTVLTGCSSNKKDTSNQTSGATEFTRNEQGYPDLQGETITIWFPMTADNSKATSDLGEYKAIQELEKKFNVNLEFIHPPIGQESDNFAIMMADKTLPDMIFGSGIDSYYPGKIDMAYSDGVLYDYTKDINETNTPNFSKLVQDDEFLKKAVTDDSGRIIRLGAKVMGSEEADLIFAGPLIRKDFLEATGLDVPETIDDWTEILTAMKASGVEYPLGLNSSTFAGGSIENIFSSAYGIDTNGFYLKEDGSVGFGPYEDSFKDYLTTLNSWYSQGLINPDFSSQTADDIMSLMSSDRVGSTISHLYTYGATYFVTTETADESKALVPVQVPVLKKGDPLSNLRKSSRELGDYKYITADAKNPIACMALLDALYLVDIDLMLANGMEGVAYNMEDGVPVAIPFPADASREVLLQAAPQQWHTTEDGKLDYILTKKYNKGAQDDALTLWKENGTSGQLSNFILFNTEESKIISQYSADIVTYVEEMTLKFITGNEPLSNFEKYQETLKQLHVEDLINTRQSATERFDAR